MPNRRDFLKGALATVSLGLGVPGVFGRAVAAAASEGSTSGKTLVVVQLAGGLDWLSTFVPYNDPLYFRARAALALDNAELLTVDDRVAFHPSLSSLKGLFDEGKVAVVQSVGYENPNFSHFKAMDIWQTADLDGTAHDGWLGRYFDDLLDDGGHPLSGLSIGRSLPDALSSPGAQVASVSSLESFALQTAARSSDTMVREETLLRLYDLFRPAGAKFAALLDTTLDNATSSSSQLKDAHASYQPAVTYPDSSLASGLNILAEYIAASPAGATPLRVGHVSLGGFDTHTQQSTRLPLLLTQTSEAITAFWRDLETHGRADDVLVLVWSEFGRRVYENAQDGTDHGSAGDVLLIGNKVRGGFHGEPPVLSNLDDGNLRYALDFRRIYATVLEDWLAAPSAPILGSHFDPLDLIMA